ncbi:MAG: RecX family transcriptional regulator [Acholeplasmataceae bacterium]|nr:RecX family transcriptional regulator [Acholeplasmataceae bacterium]MDD4193976.1 RecX family transcriptional regulator [Acholeplasmataceae bacterium]
MHTIKQVVKKSKSYMVLIDEKSLDIEPEVLLKYHLKPMMTLDDKTYHMILDDQAFYFYRKKGLKKLSKMMTSYEMKTYLSSILCEDKIIKQLIKDFESKGYLNDEIYVKNYIELKKYSDGPESISYKLKEKGIQQALIDRGISFIDEKEILSQIIPHKAKTIKKESIRQMTIKLKTYFLRKGFSLSDIDDVIREKLDWSSYNEQEVIHREFVKAYKQYAKKFSGYELRKKIFEKLYQKGYQKKDIEEVIKELDTLQIN